MGFWNKKIQENEIEIKSFERKIINEKYKPTPHDRIVSIHNIATKYVVPEVIRLMKLHRFNRIYYTNVVGNVDNFTLEHLQGLAENKQLLVAVDYDDDGNYRSRTADESLFHKIKFLISQIEIMKNYDRENEVEEQALKNYVSKMNIK